VTKELGEVVLEARGVHKRFGKNEVLKGIDLTLQRHEVVCLIGSSGSGKSTLLRCCNLLERIDEGTIEVLGTDLSNPKINEDLVHRNIGIVFQSFNLFPTRSVIDNVTLAPRRVLGMSKADAEKAALELLDRIGLADKAKDFPDRLSGGQQQRVAIVRCLAMDPSLLLLDEITSALDPELVAEVLSLVEELAGRGMTMLLATHEMGFAREVCDRVCFLDDGVLVETGTPEQIFSAPTEPATQRFLQRIIAAGRL
jgi:polar amino acid transport system ATP-binding protein